MELEGRISKEQNDEKLISIMLLHVKRNIQGLKAMMKKTLIKPCETGLYTLKLLLVDPIVEAL